MKHALVINKQTVCVSGGYYISPCQVGQTVVGYYYEWDVAYYQEHYGPLFTAQDTSAIPPINTYGTQLSIQQ